MKDKASEVVPKAIDVQRPSHGNRLSYFFDLDASEIVDRWSDYSELVSPERQEVDPQRSGDAEMMCGILRSELRELSARQPARAAEIIAEVLRRQDGQFALHAGVASATLYVASRREDLAAHLWEMLTELAPEEVEESALEIFEELKALSSSPALESVDPLAMAMFYMSHVSGSR